jgi:hypothetical protein
MATVEIPLGPELVAELEDSFFQGPMLDEKGTRSLIEVTVAFVGGMAIVIKADEHPPPHFHVKYRRLQRIGGLRIQRQKMVEEEPDCLDHVVVFRRIEPMSLSE